MKELSTEQKARAYDEAKHIMNEYLESGNAGVIAENTIKKAFPELVESEDEKIRKELLQIAKKSEDSFYMVMTPDKRKHLITWLEKQGERKSDWSEDDTQYINDTLALLSFGCSIHSVGEVQEWLQSLSNRVQLKQEWGEEDDYNLQCCIAKVQNDIDNGRIGRNRELLTWLKSLKHRSQWKPSKGQLECLCYAIEKAEKDGFPLTNNRIYLTLKALKEQLLELSGSKV